MSISKKAFFKLARETFRASKRSPCWVCGKFQSLTQAHHVFPLFLQWRIGVTRPIGDHEWLCPNHHAAMHVLIGQILSKNKEMSACGQQVISDLLDSEDEAIRFFELLNLTTAYISADAEFRKKQIDYWVELGNVFYQHAEEFRRYNDEHPGPSEAASA